MGIQLNLMAINQLEEGTVIYQEQEPVSSFFVLLKGKVSCINQGASLTFQSGSCIGVADFFKGEYLGKYTVTEQASVFAFPANKAEDIQGMLRGNKDYPGLMMLSLFRLLEDLGANLDELQQKLGALTGKIADYNNNYSSYAARYGYTPSVFQEWKELELTSSASEGNDELLEQYREGAKIPADIQKSYYSYCPGMSYRQIGEISELIVTLHKRGVRYATLLIQALQGFIDEKKNCFLKEMIHIMNIIQNAEGSIDELKRIYMDAEKEAKHLYCFLDEKIELPYQIKESLWNEIKSGEDHIVQENGTGEGISVADIMKELENSLEKFLAYAEMEEEKASEFRKRVKEFSEMKDRNSGSDEMRALRRSLSTIYYELYEKIFLRAYKEKNQTRIIDMFLNYGYLDEKLLTKEQIVQLYHRQDAVTEPNDENDLQVFTIREWLTAVLEKKKEPSKNEFDLDFYEDLREQKKTTRMSPKEEEIYVNDPMKRLKYEFRNMFMYNCRNASGQLSNFVPFLYEDIMPSNLGRLFMTKDLVKRTLEEISGLDYSLFYRETMYSNTEKGIQKEFIQVEVMPDIIILPVFGVNAVMWQDITGRRRDSKGRFLIPSMVDGDLKDLLIRVCARFRWELCRNMQGVAWNDIREKSLTSEYCDYIQFYKKNSDLSEERKEKMKQQLVKAKSNTREFFVIDYENWMKYESQGAMRLNKVARGIVATYCPFGKSIREGLSKQGIYEEAMKRYVRAKQMKIKELESHYRVLTKGLTPELEVTMRFFKEL